MEFRDNKEHESLHKEIINHILNNGPLPKPTGVPKIDTQVTAFIKTVNDCLPVRLTRTKGGTPAKKRAKRGKGATATTTTATTTTRTVAYDVAASPGSYLFSALKLNDMIEKNGGKGFHIIPVHRSFSTVFFPISTKSLIDLFSPRTAEGQEQLDRWNKDKKKEDRLSWKDWLKRRAQYSMDGRDNVWSRVFNITHSNHRPFKMKNYGFGHRLLTDGVSVSIQLDHEKLRKAEVIHIKGQHGTSITHTYTHTLSLHSNTNPPLSIDFATDSLT